MNNHKGETQMGTACVQFQKKLFIAVLVLLVGSVAARADDALLEVLRHNKLITDDQYQALRKARAEKEKAAIDRPLPAQDQDLLDVLLANRLISQAQFADLRVKVGAAKKIEQEAKVSLKEGFKVKSQDGAFQAQVGAYFQMDTALYNDDLTDFSSGNELRRGRLSVAGTVFSDWDYKLEADFAGTTQGGSTNNVTVTDAYVRYTGLKPYAFTAGNFKVPFSLEAVGSARYLTFMERGLPFAFLTLRRLGGMASANGDNWTASVGLFGDSVTSQNTDDEGMQAAGRITFAPFFQSERVLHLGVAGSWVHPQQTATGTRLETVRFRSKPESNIISDSLVESATLSTPGSTFGRSSGRLVDTGNIPGDVNYFTLFGGELAGVYGPFSVQGEYIRADMDRETGGDPGFDGYYGYASWFLSGESRNYKADKGVFDVLQPLKPFSLKTGGWGAWEVAVRYSNLDLNDEGVRGGEIDDLSFALNWYPNAYVRLMANYVDVLDVDGGAHDGDNPDLFQLRVQVAY
ncbi:MAG: OprO/OprP family phosphate-selective porin [Gammaproteobacteria bacterium]